MGSFRGTTLRITLFGWFVAIVTLAVFAAVIIPQQMNEFKLNLESKARGVAASIKGVTAGAAVSEDYSLVVDQAMQMLSGDHAIDFLVITKNSGFSIVASRSGWRTASLDAAWRPADRVAASWIGIIPLFGRRVFHYATPFDCSGLEWGWIHVGLSLDSYDASVRRSYARTGVLTILCGGLSLPFSLFFASRLVRPIHALHTTVARLAEGDPTARADMRAGGEIGELAGAFNDMAATIHARNQILESVGVAAQRFLHAANWTSTVPEVLESVGRATASSRGYVLVNSIRDGAPCCRLEQEWRAGGVASAGPGWNRLCWRDGAPGRWAEALAGGQLVTLKPAHMPQSDRRWIGPGIQSVLLIPVFVGETWWGVIGLDDCERARDWGEAEKDSLRAIADMLGSTILQQAAQDELIEAKATLELRVLDRTRQLQEQVEAKDRAHAELAAAQQRLVQLSRQAGKAEVATGVLHNVGNVLNSVNVSATLVREQLQRSRAARLAPAVDLLRDRKRNLDAFLRDDEKGRRLLPYLAKLAVQLDVERDSMAAELIKLGRHVGHIKEIVAAQQGYATTSGVTGKVSIAGLIKDAITLANNGDGADSISVECHIEPLPEVYTDQHKVLQIVLNLLRNARDATRASGNPRREIQVSVTRSGETSFQIAVTDSGVGLSPENLQRVFQHGFTTKTGGHGFGLHSGALAAKALGGRLTAASEGVGKGAAFVLELPLHTGPREERMKKRCHPPPEHATDC